MIRENDLIAISIDTIKKRNNEAGKHFFSPASMRFFDSRCPHYAYTRGDSKAYFVTSEQWDYKSPRLYTLRSCDMHSGDIDTVGEFQQYESGYHAMEALKRVIEEEARE